MNALFVATGALAILSGSAGAIPPEISPIDPQSVREWALSRGGGADEKKETVEVDLVFNFMKGVGCSDADAKTAAEAAAKKANELLKGACVRVNVKEINNDWTGPGNMDDPDTPADEADGEVNSDEIRKAKKEGLKEVTGDDGSGGTKKGYKVFIVKDFNGDLAGTAGCTIKCQPWTAIKKSVAGASLGEVLAHEIGHSFGKLDDTYDMDDMNCLMYGYTKKGSARMLKEGQGDKIRNGAKKHGRTVKKDEGAPDEAPKQPKPKANGGISKLESEPVTKPAGELVWAGINAPSLFAEPGDEVVFGFTVVRPPTSLDPTFIHMGIDMDSDPLTGAIYGPWQGVEVSVVFIFDPLSGALEFQAQDLLGGDFFNGPVMLMENLLLPDEFLPFPAPPVVPLPIPELQLEGVMPMEVFPFVVGPAPAFVHGLVSPSPDPLALPLPQVDPFQFPLLPDDFFGRPILVAPGAALPGDVIPIDGFGFPPLAPIQICIDDVPAGTVMTDPNGQFFGQPLPLDPLVFAADGSGYSFITGKAPGGVGPAGTTWVEGPAGAPCPADLDGDGIVSANDLAILLAAWGSPTIGGPDLDGDGVVSAGDLAVLLAAWGPCP